MQFAWPFATGFVEAGHDPPRAFIWLAGCDRSARTPLELS